MLSRANLLYVCTIKIWRWREAWGGVATCVSYFSCWGYSLINTLKLKKIEIILTNFFERLILGKLLAKFTPFEKFQTGGQGKEEARKWWRNDEWGHQAKNMFPAEDNHNLHSGSLYESTQQLHRPRSKSLPHFDSGNPPAPMNHAKIYKGWPLQLSPSKLVKLWYKSFHQADFCLAKMKKPTMLSNKCSTAWSYAEDQTFVGFLRIKSLEQDFEYLYW